MRALGIGCLGLVALVIAVGISNSLTNGGSRMTPTVAAPTVTMTSAPPTPTNAPAATATTVPATPTPAVFIVANTGGDGVYVRRTPGGTRVKAWPDGTEMVVIGESTQTDGATWHHVKAPDGNDGWVPAQYLAVAGPHTIPPSVAMASATPKSGVQAALDDMIALADLLNESVGERFFIRAQITESGRRLTVTVSDLWYALPSHQKERLIETFADAYAVAAAQRGLRGSEPNEANYPTTSFVDTFGKEVAFKSTWQTRVLR